MYLAYDKFGIKIIKKKDRYFLQYDAGEIVIQIREIHISDKEAQSIMKIDNSDELYKYMLENLDNRMNI